ncbi:cupin domain-containing protein [Kribbella solani]|uniref:Mannose-6-phosphate isomerase-like protein (Cupin superfamily) n=1 Tax=Kribbella solani TaxID=236067 RepID=A0A841E2I1_9ACTN|nr:mannose-6-phosphate isomerase-like protein (cupin superfamily) [Kribbella solani]
MGGFGSGAVLPGGIGVSKVTVYDVATQAGPPGGTPHVHLACAEGYYVLAGSGTVETLNTKGYTETPLQAGTMVWFEPGTIHRLINGGGLVILALMANSGLPEAGDAVLTLPPRHLADREAYQRATALSGEGDARTTAAIARRDLALQGYADLRERYESDGPIALASFFAAAIRIVQPQLADWRHRWEQGARRLADATGTALDALEIGDAAYLERAEVGRLNAPTESGRHGMCGWLDIYETGVTRA